MFNRPGSWGFSTRSLCAGVGGSGAFVQTGFQCSWRWDSRPQPFYSSLGSSNSNQVNHPQTNCLPCRHRSRTGRLRQLEPERDRPAAKHRHKRPTRRRRLQRLRTHRPLVGQRRQLLAPQRDRPMTEHHHPRLTWRRHLLPAQLLPGPIRVNLQKSATKR